MCEKDPIFASVGYENYLNASPILAILSPDSAPAKRLWREAKERGKLIDATSGRKTRSVEWYETDHVAICALQPKTLVRKINVEIKRRRKRIAANEHSSFGKGSEDE